MHYLICERKFVQKKYPTNNNNIYHYGHAGNEEGTDLLVY